MVQKTAKPLPRFKALLRDERFWQVALQIIVFIAVVATFYYLYGNLKAKGQAEFDLGFLQNTAGFPMSDNILGYQPTNSYAKIMQAGVINSFRVVIVGIILATIVGITAGVASFSTNWLLQKISRVYVGLMRNVPLLLQLIFWYTAVFRATPNADNQIVFPDEALSWVVISNKGIRLPGPSFPNELWVGIILLVLALLLGGLLWRSANMFRLGRFGAGIGGWLSRGVNVAIIVAVVITDYFLLFSNSAEDRLYFTGAVPAFVGSPQGLWVLALMGLAAGLVYVWKLRTQAMLTRGEDGNLLLGMMGAIALATAAIIIFAFGWKTPVIVPNGAEGGLPITMEYAAVVTGLTFYTGAFIAEIVRAGIQSVSRGQWEAARSLGLSNSKAMQLVVFPQSLQVIIPPLNSEFANLAKNSSLAIAVGYQDLYSVAYTSLNQSGRAIEVIAVMMGTYLLINLLISINMNQLNAVFQVKGR